MRIKNVLSWFLTTALVGGGLALVAVFILQQGLQSTSTNEENPGGFNVPEVAGAQGEQADGGPEDKTLKITIPGLSRIEDDTVPGAAGDDTQALGDNAAIHLEGTGFPWQDAANVYLAGHRLGYPGTDSFLAFYDQGSLESGDEIYVEDSEGTEYTYRVFDSSVVSPTEVDVTQPVEGQNILTLQTCTLPDYTQRLLVRAVKVEGP